MAGQAHHAIHVLRLQTGDAITLFDGRGVEYAAVIRRIDKSGLTLAVTTRSEIDRESPLKVTLAQGVSSGERMDYTVQKCVELGISAIQPLMTQRSVVRLSGERADKRVAHWRAIAVAACEQCGRNYVPEVLPVQALTSWLGTPQNTTRYLLSPGAPTRLRELDRPQGPITLLVGPEGGWAPEELAEAARSPNPPPIPEIARARIAAMETGSTSCKQN